MTWQPVPGPSGDVAVVPNVQDYEQARAGFSWAGARREELDGLPDGRGLNIAHEAVDRHAAGSRANHLALRWLGRHGETWDFTYAKLSRLSNRFANVLDGLGVGVGDRVFTLLGRIPELYVVALGAWKNRSVFCPLFSAFGPEPIHARLRLGEAKVLVTTPDLYSKKVKGLRDRLPELRHVLLVDRDELAASVGAAETGEGSRSGRAPGSERALRSDHTAGVRNLAALLAQASDEFVIPPTDPEDMAIVHFTSGTTGTPKGAVHVHDAVLTHHVTGKLALDLHADDVFWCTADPGWVTGTSYGIIAPLTNAVTTIVDEGDLDAERWYGILRDQRVSVWYTAPTAVRMLMKIGTDVARRFDLPSLRFIASVGEPLNPEAVLWGKEAFGLPIHDNWWQTETGGIMIANLAGMEIRPGSMGRPLPGIEAGIVKRAAHGRVEDVTDAEVEGELALRPGWPSMFRGYLGAEERYRKCFAGGWYLTGDLVRRDADGFFWFVARADDVIKSAGHLIGPFEVESVLMEHPGVAEAGVIGKPDAVAGEVVKAFVSLKPGYSPDDALRLELLGFARSRLGAAIAPREIEFVTRVPQTRSGKIMRRLLKARELGQPEGDVSTLEA